MRGERINFPQTESGISVLETGPYPGNGTSVKNCSRSFEHDSLGPGFHLQYQSTNIIQDNRDENV